MKNKYINDLLLILAGSFFVALSIVSFFIQHNIAAGGPPGVAILLHFFTGISLGWGMIIINVPLIWLGYKKFGRLYFGKLIIAIVAVSLFTDVLAYFISEYVLTNMRIINAILGGFFAGLGIGLISVAGTASSGWVALAQVIAKALNVKIGQTCFALDCLLLVAFSLVFKEIETAIYGFLAVFIVGKTIDITIKYLKKTPSESRPNQV